MDMSSSRRRDEGRGEALPGQGVAILIDRGQGRDIGSFGAAFDIVDPRVGLLTTIRCKYGMRLQKRL